MSAVRDCEALIDRRSDVDAWPPVRLRVGDRVRCERETPARDTWKRYAGRTGTVVTLNQRDGEIGLTFGHVRTRPDGSIHGDDTVTWFLPSELVPADAPNGGAAPVKAPKSATEPRTRPTTNRGYYEFCCGNLDCSTRSVFHRVANPADGVVWLCPTCRQDTDRVLVMAPPCWCPGEKRYDHWHFADAEPDDDDGGDG